MGESSPPIRPVTAQQGRSLYLIVRDAIREAVDAGKFKPGERLPSTKELSQQLEVSLVTAHRALQELVTIGVLQRAQGRGTFVHPRYFDRKLPSIEARVGLFFHPEASLADFYHSQVMEGVRQGAMHLSLDLVLLRFGEDIRNECNGYLYVNPWEDQVEALRAHLPRKQPVVAVGVMTDCDRASCLDIDNLELGRKAVDHLFRLGHRRIGYLGSGEQLSNSLQRWEGFRQGCEQHGVTIDESRIVKGSSWQLNDTEMNDLLTTLASNSRPTAMFCGGFFFALDAYGAAARLGLRIPQDLSIIAVDDPPSAAHLSPPLTTLRQPLNKLGQDAITLLYEKIRKNDSTITKRILNGELIIRASTAAPSKT